MKLFLIALILVGLAAIIAHDTRTFEVMLPMRDGVKLHTRVALPRNFEGKKFATIMDRSPYGYDALEMAVDIFLPFGFVTIGQDMRGTKKSEGNFTIWHSDANDSEDLGNWIVEQDWSNGEVYTFGASADGLAAFTTVFNSPSWLKRQYFIWSSCVGYEVIFPNGAYLEALADTWIRSTVKQEADACLAEIEANEAMTSWWDVLELTGKENLVKSISGFWAGWYDIFLVGNLVAYDSFNYKSDPSVRHQSRLTVDPLGHCQSAAEYFKPHLIEGRTALAIAQAYETFGAFEVQRSAIKNVTFYVMSSNDEAGENAGLYWTSLEKFPTPTMRKYYAHSDGSATTTPPTLAEGDTSTSYTYDPANPITSHGGNNLDLPCGPLDQSDIDKRSDVILFTTPVFTEELPLTGPLFADLYVSSDAIDTDFMVRIEDVYPTGEARLLQDSAIRMRWREGGLTPLFMAKGEVYHAHMSLWNTSYVVAPGHQLRFAISSSNHPRFSVNRNNGLLLAEGDGEFITAQNAFHHSSKYPSSFSLPVVKKRELPKVHVVEEVQKAYPQLDIAKINKDYPDLFSKLMTSNKVK